MECLIRNLFGRNYLASAVFYWGDSNGFVYGIWICDRSLLHLFYILKVGTMCTTKKCIKAVVNNGRIPIFDLRYPQSNGIDSCQFQVGWYLVENIIQ